MIDNEKNITKEEGITTILFTDTVYQVLGYLGPWLLAMLLLCEVVSLLLKG